MNIPSIEDFDDEDETSVYHSNEQKVAVAQEKTKVEVIFTPNVPTWGVTDENQDYSSLIAEENHQVSLDELGSEMEDPYVNSVEKTGRGV